MNLISIPYSGKFSWGPIFAYGQSSKIIFADMCNHAHYIHVLYNRTYFAGLFFVDSHLSAKIGSHENFPLYSSMIHYYHHKSLVVVS
jgi:hypothetical protein